MGFAALRCLSHRSLAAGGGRAGNGARGGARRAGRSVTRRPRLARYPAQRAPEAFPAAPRPAHPGDKGRGTAARAQRGGGGRTEEDVRHALGLSGARPGPKADGHPSA